MTCSNKHIKSKMSGDEQTRDEIEETVNDEPVQKAVAETIQEEEIKPVKAKPKAKAKAKPKIKTTKEPVEPIESAEPVEPESLVAVEEPPKKIYKDKQMVNCPDCNILNSTYTIIYSKKRIL